MNKKECVMLLSMMEVGFEAFTYVTDEDMDAIQLWYEFMSDIDFEVGRLTVMQVIAQYRYKKPTINFFRETYLDIIKPKRDGMEAWGNVRDIIASYGLYHGAEGLKKIQEYDEISYKIVKSIGIRTLAMATDSTSNRARFIDAYENSLNTEHNTALMPTDLALRIAEKKTEFARLGKRGSNTMSEIAPIRT